MAAFYFKHNSKFKACQSSEQACAWFKSNTLDEYGFRNSKQIICNTNEFNIPALQSWPDDCRLDTNFALGSTGSTHLHILNEDIVPMFKYITENDKKYAYFTHPGSSAVSYRWQDKQLFMSGGTGYFKKLTLSYNKDTNKTDIVHTNANGYEQSSDCSGAIVVCAVQANGGDGSLDYYKTGVGTIAYTGGGGGAGAFCIFMCNTSLNAISIIQQVQTDDQDKQESIRIIIHKTDQISSASLYALDIFAGQDAPPVSEASGDVIEQYNGSPYGDGGQTILTDYSSLPSTITSDPNTIRNILCNNSSVHMMAITEGSHGGAGSLYFYGSGFNTNSGSNPEQTILPYYNLDSLAIYFQNPTPYLQDTQYNQYLRGLGGVACIRFNPDDPNYTPGQGGWGGFDNSAFTTNKIIRPRTVGRGGCIILQTC